MHVNSTLFFYKLPHNSDTYNAIMCYFPLLVLLVYSHVFVYALSQLSLRWAR